MNATFETIGPSLWLSLWAKLTVCATFVLLGLGAVVTTFHVGMADPVWPTYPWHLLLISWEEPRPGFLIEHAHRLAGYIVGCCVIVLAIGLWVRDRRPLLRALGLVALAGVIIQGLLGGFRVYLDERFGVQLAMFHGSFAPLVFTLLVGVAMLTSRGWRQPSVATARPGKAVTICRWAVVTTALIYLQIVLGGFLRHTYSTIGSRGHLLVAFAVVAAVIWLAREILDNAGRRDLVAASAVLVALVALQVFLGVEAWMVKFLAFSDVTVQAVIRTGHVLLGAAVLATSAVVTLKSFRLAAASQGTPIFPAGRLEGAA